MEYINHLPVARAIKLLERATEESEREKIFELYLVDRPSMTKQNFMSFKQYYEEMSVKRVDKIDTRSKEEIMRDLGFIQ